jgi:hypothetical protein
VPLRAAQDHDAPVPDARSLPRSSRTANPSNGPTTRRYRGVRIKDLDPQVLTIAQGKQAQGNLVLVVLNTRQVGLKPLMQFTQYDQTAFGGHRYVT